MTPDRLKQISQIYADARTRRASEREAFLAEACAGDASLQREVQALLDQSTSPHWLDGLTPSMVAPALGPVDEGVNVTGRRFGAYLVHERIGVGGMGEVYRARDTRLGRDVAIKVLPRAFANDADRLARFEREARVLAALDHPHIGTIHGIEESDGVRALVLGLVGGDTLTERIALGPLSIADALEYARQIADALEAAHDKGIIHRDLKPANIKVRPDGTVKVLDFGLAKAFDIVGGPADASQSPSITSPMMTRAGVVLGTAAYMSPEQARSKAVDRRCDVWAFGCVLYEMLTGRPAFPGDSVQDVLARVIEREPEWSRVPATVPARVQEILRSCLEKDPRKRRRDMGDVRLEIERAQSEPAQGSRPIVERASSRRARLAWIAGAVLAVALAIAVARPYFMTQTRLPETRLDVGTPEMSNPTRFFAISPEGRRLAFAAQRDGRSQLYVRSLDRDTAQPLSGTEGAGFSFWSPDGRSIGFFAENQLKRIDLDGGLVQTLTRIGSSPQGGTWGSDGVILLAGQTGPVFRIAASASGGEPTAVTKLDAGVVSHRGPVFLPGSRQFLFFATGTEAVRGIYLGSLDTPDATRLTDAEAMGGYVATGRSGSTPGWLLFVRQGALVARRFDPARRQLSGDPVTVAESVAVLLVHGAVSVSSAGVIAYRTGATPPKQLTWFDRSGKALGTLGEIDRADQMNVELSHDGLRAVVQRTAQNNMDVWIIDSARSSRFTFDGGIDGGPLWSPDGTQIAYQSTKTGAPLLYRRASGSNDANADEQLGKGILRLLCDWSRDGRFLMYATPDDKTGFDLWVLPMDGDRTPFPFVRTSFNELWGQFSPDGRWVAYQSNESGRWEIYIQPFKGPGSRVPVSTSGGIRARWAPNGKELFFIAPDGKLMASPLTSRGTALDAGTPGALFQTMVVGGGRESVGFRQQYDVAPDGRFLINVAIDTTPVPITLIQNWKPPASEITR
jgi:serine/threonine protein kinase/Tol biopolymer transport system component